MVKAVPPPTAGDLLIAEVYCILPAGCENFFNGCGCEKCLEREKEVRNLTRDTVDEYWEAQRKKREKEKAARSPEPASDSKSSSSPSVSVSPASTSEAA